MIPCRCHRWSTTSLACYIEATESARYGCGRRHGSIDQVTDKRERLVRRFAVRTQQRVSAWTSLALRGRAAKTFARARKLA